MDGSPKSQKTEVAPVLLCSNCILNPSHVVKLGMGLATVGVHADTSTIRSFLCTAILTPLRYDVTQTQTTYLPASGDMPEMRPVNLSIDAVEPKGAPDVYGKV